MAVLIDSSYKNHIGECLTNRLGLAIRYGEVEFADAEKIIASLLTAIDSMTYREEISNLLLKLSEGWPFFKEIADQEGMLLESQPIQQGII